jgi:hypothetical protein
VCYSPADKKNAAELPKNSTAKIGIIPTQKAEVSGFVILDKSRIKP